MRVVLFPFLALAMLFIVACGSEQTEPPTAAFVQVDPTATAEPTAVPAEPPTATPTPTPSPLPSSTPTPTEVPTPVLTATPEPTSTPLPTIALLPTIEPPATLPPFPGVPAEQTATPEPTRVLEDIGLTESFTPEAVSALRAGKELLRAKEYEGAIALFEEALKLHGQPSAVIHASLGLAHEYLGEHSLAVEHYTQAIEVQESSGRWANRARNYRKLGQCDLAKQDALKSLELEEQRGEIVSTHKNAHQVLSGCYRAEGDYSQAILHKEAELAIDAEMGHPSNKHGALLTTLAVLYSKAGDSIQSADYAEQALAAAVYDYGNGSTSHSVAEHYR